MTETNLRVADIRPFIGAKHFDTSRDFYVALGIAGKTTSVFRLVRSDSCTSVAAYLE